METLNLKGKGMPESLSSFQKEGSVGRVNYG